MAISSKVGSFSTGTGALGTTVVVSDTGFQPEAIIFWWSGRSESVDAVGRGIVNRGYGFATGATSRAAVASNSADASASSNTAKLHREDCCIAVVDSGGTVNGIIDFQSFDTGGFTLVVDDVMPRDQRIHYLALAGDITNAAVGGFTSAGVIGDQDITSLAFQPDFALFISSFDTVVPSDSAAARMIIGAAVSSSQMATMSNVSRDAQVTMDTYSTANDAEVIAVMSTTALSVSERATFVSFLSNGFRINWTEAANARPFTFLALKGGNYSVGSILTQTDTTTDITKTGLGFKPSAVLLFSTGKAEDAVNTGSDHDRWSIGAVDSSLGQGAQASLDEDATLDSEVTTAIEFGNCYVNIATDSTVQGLMSVTALGSDGFTARMSDADPGQAFVGFIAFGPGEGTKAPPPFHRRNYLWNRRF